MSAQTSPLEPLSVPSPCTPSSLAPAESPEPTLATDDPTESGRGQSYVVTDIGNVCRSDKLAEVEIVVLINVTHGNNLKDLLHGKLRLLDKTNRLFVSYKTVLVRILQFQPTRIILTRDIKVDT